MNYYSIIGDKFLENNKSGYNIVTKKEYTLKYVPVVLSEGNFMDSLIMMLVQLFMGKRKESNTLQILVLTPLISRIK
jgi:hypothetical protein